MNIDALKCIAAFTVVLLHSAADRLFDQGTNIDSLSWPASNFYDATSRWCVPVFVMISGFLLLDQGKEEPLGVFYSKRASRILIPLVFWSLFYSVWTIARTWEEQEAQAAFLKAGTNLLRGIPYHHLWFLYMLVGIYAFVPFIRKAVWTLSPIELTLLCTMLLTFSAAISASSCLSGFESGKGIFLKLSPLYLAYFILGYHLPRVDGLKTMKKTVPAALFLLGALSTAAACYLLGKHGNIRTGMYFYDSFSPTVIVASLSIFVFFQQWDTNAEHRRIVAFFAPTMLGVYLIHPPILRLLEKLWRYGDHQAWYAIPTIAIAAYLISVVLIKALQRTPMCRRVV